MQNKAILFVLILATSITGSVCIVNTSTRIPDCVTVSPSNGVIYPTAAVQPAVSVNGTLQYMLEKSNIIIFNITVIARPVGNYTNDTLVDGIWISAKICNTDSSRCINKTTPTKPTTKQSTEVRTAAQCTWARAKDWEAYVNIAASERMFIDYSNPNQNAKNAILNNLVNSSQSYQARCLRGEINQNNV